MKTLLIIRHAKSSWDIASLNDFDRSLNERGKKDAPRMAKRLKEKDIYPDVMISSPAKRGIAPNQNNKANQAVALDRCMGTPQEGSGEQG